MSLAMDRLAQLPLMFHRSFRAGRPAALRVTAPPGTGPVVARSAVGVRGARVVDTA